MINENDDKETIETKETIQEAQERYEQLQKDKHEMELAELRLKYILDQNSIRASGYREGKEEGVKENARDVAKKLYEQGVDKDIIIKATSLTNEEVDEIINGEK